MGNIIRTDFFEIRIALHGRRLSCERDGDVGARRLKYQNNVSALTRGELVDEGQV
jgi:hypothetical protein